MDLKPRIFIAEDDEDDYGLVRDALAKSHPDSELVWATDGNALLEKLESETFFPDLILLDLNMPKMDGRVALKKIKENPLYRSIPVVILTTSNSKEDVEKCYAMGANSYVRKPGGFGQLVEFMAVIQNYWFNITVLPPRISSN